jgi:predicted N-acetyltransferase YhbS
MTSPINYIWIENTSLYRDGLIHVITEGLGELRSKEAMEAWDADAISFLIAVDNQNHIIGCGAIGRFFMYKQSYFLAFNSVLENYRGLDIGNTITQKRVERIKELGGRFIWSAGKDHWKRYTKFNFKHLCELNSDGETHHMVVQGL